MGDRVSWETAEAKVWRLENSRRAPGSVWSEHRLGSEEQRAKGSWGRILEARLKSLDCTLEAMGSHRWSLSRTSCHYLRKLI